MPIQPPLESTAEISEYINDWIRNDATPAFQGLRMNTVLQSMLDEMNNIVVSGGGEPTIAAGTSSQYWRGDKTWQTLNKAAVGLGNVQNVDQTNAANLTSGLIAAARFGPLSIPVSAINATGTADSTTVLFGDGTWGTVNVTDGDKGHITVAGSSWTINDDAITLVMLPEISANRVLGRTSSGTGDIEELTGTQITSLLDIFTSTHPGIVPASGGGTVNFLRADGVWADPGAGGGGVSDGDKGDITVSSGGVTWTIDALAVTNGKINDVAFSKVTGTISAAQVAGTATNGYVATLVGGVPTWTAPSGSSLSDGDYGDINISGGVWTIEANAVTVAKMQNISTATFLGRATAGSGIVEVMSGTQATALLDVFTTSVKGLVPAATGGSTTTEFLRKDGTWAVPSGSGVGVTDGDKGDITVSGTGATWTVDNDAITFAKFQNITQARLLGRYTASTGDMQEITLGTGLSLNSSTGELTASGGGQFTLSGSDIYNSNAGNVLIGTSTSTGDKFRVVGSVRLDIGSDATGDIFYRDSSGSLERLPAPSGLTTPMLSYGTTPEWIEATGGGGGGGESLEDTLTIGNTTTLPIQFNTSSGTNRNFNISVISAADNLAAPRFYPSGGTNVGLSVSIVPRGTGFTSDRKADLILYNTDVVADGSNYESLQWGSKGTDGYIWNSIKAGTGTTRDMAFQVASTNAIHVSGSTRAVTFMASTSSYTFPTTRPTANQILKDNGSGTGTLIWAADGGGTATTINNNANNRVITGSGTANTLEAEASLTLDASILLLHSPTGETPALRFSDADITPSNFSTNVGFTPSLGTNTFGNISTVSATYGGVSLNGFTNSTAAASGIVLAGYIGHTTPTGSAIYLRGAKWNGTTSAVALAATEKILTINNWTTEVVAWYGTGALALNGSTGTSGQVLTSGGAGAAATWTTLTGGVTTMAAIGASPNANGATISSSTLTLQPASASFGGVVTTGTQTFAGAKTFASVILPITGTQTLLAGNLGLSSANSRGFITQNRDDAGNYRTSDPAFLLEMDGTSGGQAYRFHSVGSGTAGTLAVFDEIFTITPTVIIQNANSYHNWGNVSGSSGYGIRDNGGVMEYKNSGGAWTPF